MSQDLKDQLVRLGSTNPELREHIRPVLRHVDAGRFDVSGTLDTHGLWLIVEFNAYGLKHHVTNNMDAAEKALRRHVDKVRGALEDVGIFYDQSDIHYDTRNGKKMEANIHWSFSRPKPDREQLDQVRSLLSRISLTTR